MSEEEEKNLREEQIVEASLRVFMTYGIKSVTMDDVAKHLRISKKTLYLYFKDKNDLVQRCLDFDCVDTERRITAIQAKELNAIDEIFEISQYVLEELRSIHPSIFHDLEKYYPGAFNAMHNLHHEHVIKVIRRNLDNGIREGVYRDNLHVEVMSILWVQRLNLVFRNDLFPMPKYNLAEVYLQIFDHHIRGIASKKGLKYHEKKLSKLN